jgi:hypothetical protein
VNDRLAVVNVGTAENPSYLPADVCEVVPGQEAKSKLSPVQTAKMIEFAVRVPADNAQSIVDNGLSIIGSNPANVMLSHMGISIGQQMMTVPGRVLPGVKVAYDNVTHKNQLGASWNLLGVNRMTRTASWLPISIMQFHEHYTPDATAAVDQLIGFLRKYGIGATNPLDHTYHRVDLRNPDVVEAKVNQAFTEVTAATPTARLYFVLLPSNDATLYKCIKKNGDIVHGVHTICSVVSKITKDRNAPYLGNLVPKFNLKLGGTNQTVEGGLGLIKDGKTMVVGIDVTHPSPGSSSAAPSVAGMVASVDKNLGQWPAILRLQHVSKSEMVDELKDMLKSRLQLWRTYNNTLPENILIYRDGVSEGQYSVVLDKELPLLRQACQEMYPPADTTKSMPRMSIIIVGKRHHTRFYPTNIDRADPSSNPESGTVVDRGVTESRNWNFFMQAHSALHGTARPAHYYIILDEIFRSQGAVGGAATAADRLEELTHKMCYLFGRATKAVSICPPAYYADLVCERARCYLSRYYDAPTATASVVSGQTGNAPTQADIAIHPRLVNTMYYI